MSVSDSDQESSDSSSSEDGEIWKRKKLKQYKESFLNLDDCINANYNYESLRSRLVSHSNVKNKNENSKGQTFQEIIMSLQKFWSKYGCVLLQPYD